MPKWENREDLKEGDILRMKVSNPKHPKYGQYYYSVCTGSGFGCNGQCSGNAIFVEFQSFVLEDVIKNRDKVNKGKDNPSDRWERFWGIEVLEG